ncbi:MAG: hypothetical protein PHF37_03615 [Phycisphaerae bacterium]|nr:hypothetical protein [Phycisphaerae bacterium]
MKIFEKLAFVARNEQPPFFDVSDDVLLRIDSLGQPKYTFLPFDFFAAVSAVAASVVAFLSIHAWQSIVNPLVQLFTPLQEVPLW